MAVRIAIGIVLLFATNAYSQDFGKLLSPGDLSSPHQELTGLANCTGCHTLRGSLPDEKCLECHKDIGSRIRQNRGYHAMAAREKKTCVSCHPDHKGKQSSLIEWNEKIFDHSETATGYPLTGKHATTLCGGCHTAKTKRGRKSFFLEKTECASCHEDIHKGALGAECASCHNTNGWTGKNARFDHDKVYRLEGAHAKANCAACHKQKGRFKVEGFEKCATCHAKDDKHKGALGAVCEDCHTVTNWKDILFNHSRTRYPLRGAHQKAACGSCHYGAGEGNYKIARFDTCSASGCHDTKKRGAIHGDQFKDRRCETCHTVKGWKPSRFTHDSPAYTGFKLEGKHRKVECAQCHRPGLDRAVVYQPIDTSGCGAAGCHDTKKRGAIHGDQFKDRRCEDCHTVQGWQPSLFRHEAESYRGYKLHGKHASAKCETCHKPDTHGVTAYRPIDVSGCGAAGCHGDPHKGQFRDQRCDSCHSEESWKKLAFDHDRNSRFALRGKHTSAACGACHINKVWKPLQTGCYDCHRKDDVHKKKMGARCDECHNEKTWKLDAFAHEITGFKLDGAHGLLTCADCHAKQAEVIEPGEDCVQCHTDPHFNQFGTFCEDCHDSKTWEPLKFRHNETGFRLEGAHRIIECESCHQNRDYRTTPTDCFACHSTEFFSEEGGRFHEPTATNCEDCHRTYAWRPATQRFQHRVMTFTNAHRAIESECEACHLPNSADLLYPAAQTEEDCEGCHMDDFAGFHGDGNPPGLPPCPLTCALCHNIVDWSIAREEIACD